MNAIILVVTASPIRLNSPAGFIPYAIVTLLIFGYLMYSLIKPEKF